MSSSTSDVSTDWTPYLVGGGLLFLGGLVGAAVLAKRAVPKLLPPELLPHYEAFQQAGSSSNRLEHIRRMADTLGGTSRSVFAPAASNYEVVWSESPLLAEGTFFYDEPALRRAMQRAAEGLVQDRARGETWAYYKTKLRRLPDGEEIKVYVKPGDTRRTDWLSDPTSGVAFSRV